MRGSVRSSSVPSRFRWVWLEVVSEKRKALQKSVSTDKDLGFTIKADPEFTHGKGDSKESMVKLGTIIRMNSDSEGTLVGAWERLNWTWGFII